VHRADPEALEQVRAFLEDFWGDRLDQLESTLEQPDG